MNVTIPAERNSHAHMFNLAAYAQELTAVCLQLAMMTAPEVAPSYGRHNVRHVDR